MESWKQNLCRNIGTLARGDAEPGAGSYREEELASLNDHLWFQVPCGEASITLVVQGLVAEEESKPRIYQKVSLAHCDEAEQGRPVSALIANEFSFHFELFYCHCKLHSSKDAKEF